MLTESCRNHRHTRCSDREGCACLCHLATDKVAEAMALRKQARVLDLEAWRINETLDRMKRESTAQEIARGLERPSGMSRCSP